MGFLDGVRGFAALYVLITHCMIWGGWYGVPIPDPKIAVDVFMILSGYLMVYQWHARDPLQHTSWRSAVCQFWLRRLFRIAPLYYLILIITFLLGDYYKGGWATIQAAYPIRWPAGGVYDTSTAHYQYTLTNLLTHITFVFGLLPRYVGSTALPDWSIGLEMQFYLIFPFLLRVWRRIGSSALWISIGLLGVVAQRFAAAYFVEPSFLPLKLPVFFCGMITAEANYLLASQEHKGQGVNHLLLAIMAASTVRHSIPAILIIVVCLITLLVSGSRQPNLPLLFERVLQNRAARFLGDMSYAVYLIHGFAISLVGGQWFFRNSWFLARSPAQRTLILFMSTLVLSYSVGYVLHKLVERPGIAAGKRLIALLSATVRNRKQTSPLFLSK